MSKLSETLTAEIVAVIQFKLVLWPPEMIVPCLDAIRQMLLLHEVAEKFQKMFHATHGDNNLLLMCVSVGFLGDNVKSAPRIFAMRCIANSFQHSCLHDLLLADAETILDALHASADAADERERQAYADVLLKYVTIS